MQAAEDAEHACSVENSITKAAAALQVIPHLLAVNHMLHCVIGRLGAMDDASICLQQSLWLPFGTTGQLTMSQAT